MLTRALSPLVLAGAATTMSMLQILKKDASPELIVEPSQQGKRWSTILNGRTLDFVALRTIINEESPGVATYELRSFISGRRPGRTILCKDRHSDKVRGNASAIDNDDCMFKKRVCEVQDEFLRLRDLLLPVQVRTLDLRWLRSVKRDGNLSLFLGGGNRCVGNNIGYWFHLCQYLIHSALSGKVTKQPTWFGYLRTLDKFATWKQTHLAVGTAMILLTMYFQSALYSRVVSYTYQRMWFPGAIHRAIAEMATPIVVRGKRRPGLILIASQDFSDLIGEALDNRGIKRRTVTAVNGERVSVGSGSATSEALCRSLESSTTQMLYHVNGWVPKEHNAALERGTVAMLHAAAEDAKSDSMDANIVEAHFKKYSPSANFVRTSLDAAVNSQEKHVLFIGVSFDDPSGAQLLNLVSHDSSQCHTLFTWPSHKYKCCFNEATAAMVREESKYFAKYKILPIWFDSREEIPGLLREIG